VYVFSLNVLHHTILSLLVKIMFRIELMHETYLMPTSDGVWSLGVSVKATASEGAVPANYQVFSGRRRPRKKWLSATIMSSSGG
jgi:hypothetical protein